MDMNESLFPVEKYLLQRDRMMLIDFIVQADGQKALTRSETKTQWPLYANGYISPLVIVELVAQTAGVSIRREEILNHGDREDAGGGLIVGIKEAVFFSDGIPLNATVTTCAEKRYVYMNYAEYFGYSAIGDSRLGEVTLQVLRTE